MSELTAAVSRVLARMVVRAGIPRNRPVKLEEAR